MEKVKSFSKEIFNKFDMCFVQNQETQKRLHFLEQKI